MKKSYSIKKLLASAIIVLIISEVLIGLSLLIFRPVISEQTQAIAVKSVSPQIQAEGAIVAEDQATLHFQTAGKLTYLPFKEGDVVQSGQTIASLDTTTLQKQLTEALNTYRSTRDTFDQALQNQDENVLQEQQSALTGQNNVDYLNDVVKRIVDQNQANLDNSVLSVEIAQQALQLATLTSPLKGVITYMDVTTPGVNVTPTTSFVVADPSTLVFRANVAESDIDYITEGSRTTITINGGITKMLTGTVTKIYPDKMTLPTGEKVYEVDILPDSQVSFGKMGQTGSVIIQSNLQDTARLVPTWTILNHNSIWVLSHGQAMLKQVTVGKTHGDMTEVLDGLSDDDQIITNPQAVAAQKYNLL